MHLDEGILPRLAADAQLPERWLGHIGREELYEQFQFWHLKYGG